MKPDQIATSFQGAISRLEIWWEYQPDRRENIEEPFGLNEVALLANIDIGRTGDGPACDLQIEWECQRTSPTREPDQRSPLDRLDPPLVGWSWRGPSPASGGELRARPGVKKPEL